MARLDISAVGNKAATANLMKHDDRVVEGLIGRQRGSNSDMSENGANDEDHVVHRAI